MTKLKTVALAAALIAGASGAAMAQTYSCPAGYVYSAGMCQPAMAPAPGAFAPSNPVTGAVAGEEAGAQRGAAVAGPVGAVVGGALGLAGGTLAGTANAVAGAPVATTPPAYGSTVPPAPMQGTCPMGYTLYMGACYPAR